MLAIVSGFPARLAIVTGGTRGIGYGISRSLARAGYDLLLTYNTNATAALEAERRLEAEFRVSVTCEAGDLCDEDVRARLFESVDRSEGRLCAVVHSAGQYLGVTSDNSRGLPATSAGLGDGVDSAEKWDAYRYYQALYGEAFLDLCEKAVQRMGEEGGSIVGISSPGCAPLYNPNLGYDLPGSGKCIMEYAIRLIALRCAGRGINANVVVPGVTRTKAWERLAESRGVDVEELVGGIAERIAPMGPMQAEDVGRCVQFLCERRARWITGTVLPVDGGVHLRV